MANAAIPAHLLELPAEIILHILTFLEPPDLARSAQTCRALQTQTYDDQLWQLAINHHLPQPIFEPTPLKSFRDLYIAHHPHWFLPKYRIWFGDCEPNGKLLVARYDPRRGCIEAYTVVAMRGHHTLEFWEKDREVIIHSFNPMVSFDETHPVLKLDVDSPLTDDHPNSYPSDRGYGPSSLYSKETLMETFSDAGLYGSFMLCRSLPKAAIGENTRVWPPLRFPAETRVRNGSSDGYKSTGHRPTSFSEVSQHNFRLRKWVEYTGRHASPNFVSSFASTLGGLSAGLGLAGPQFPPNLGTTTVGGLSIRFPEDITTYATLPPSCYTPTKDKPWQGIWCGDYSGHGCEFLVVSQPDKKDERSLPEGMDWLRSWFRSGRRVSASSETRALLALENVDASVAAQQEPAGLSSAEATQSPVQGASPDPNEYGTPGSEPPPPPPPLPDHMEQHESISDYDDAPSGRLDAIKLTGDPNIPCGEYTFIAPDIGHGGFMRVADEEIFRGARIVRSAGHIAGRGFREGESPRKALHVGCDSVADRTDADQYTPSQLIMISHDRLAQFWEAFGHISYYQRVDLDALAKM